MFRLPQIFFSQKSFFLSQVSVTLKEAILSTLAF